MQSITPTDRRIPTRESSVTGTTTGEGWQTHAACIGKDPELFHEPEGERPAARHGREHTAKRICAACPVTQPCLQLALATQPAGRLDTGIFGGTTPAERARMRGVVPHAARALSETQARVAHERAKTLGVPAVAAGLELTATALYRIWAQLGLPAPVEPERQRRPWRSRAWTDRQVATAAFDLAEAEGISETIRQTGMSYETLARAWAHHGMGRPDTRQAARRRQVEATHRRRPRLAASA